MISRKASLVVSLNSGKWSLENSLIGADSAQINLSPFLGLGIALLPNLLAHLLQLFKIVSEVVLTPKLHSAPRKAFLHITVEMFYPFPQKLDFCK